MLESFDRNLYEVSMSEIDTIFQEKRIRMENKFFLQNNFVFLKNLWKSYGEEVDPSLKASVENWNVFPTKKLRKRQVQ